MSDSLDKLIFDVTESNFTEAVIKGSTKNLILVDFWAPWCGPCKQLTPLLTKVVEKAKGKVTFCAVELSSGRAIGLPKQIRDVFRVAELSD